MNARPLVEEWRTVAHGFYEVSNLGRIRRAKPGRGARVGRILTPTLLPIGYESVPILKRRLYIHALVAEAFLGPKPDGCVVDHVDGNKQNNLPSNLEYVSRAENNRRACAMGLLPPPPIHVGEENHNAKLDATKVREIRLRRTEGEALSALASEFGVSDSTVSSIALGKTWKHLPPNPTELVVLIDDREKRPYRFPCVGSTITRLHAGDYSLKGLETQISIERKRLDELFAATGTGRLRFERELQILSTYDYAAIVIEADLPQILQGVAFSHVSPKAVIGSLISWSIRYRTCVFFAGDRAHGNALTYRLLEKYCRYRQERMNKSQAP